MTYPRTLLATRQRSAKRIPEPACHTSGNKNENAKGAKMTIFSLWQPIIASAVAIICAYLLSRTVAIGADNLTGGIFGWLS